MEPEGSEMTFWEHLEELRGGLLRSLAVLAVMLLPVLCFKEFIFNHIVLAPLSVDFPTYKWFALDCDVHLVNLEISGQFRAHLLIALAFSIILSCPYLIYEAWRFLSPALYEKERKVAIKAFSLSALLFYAGVAVGYFIILPLCLSFFQSYVVSGGIENTFSLQSYISLFASMVLLLGLTFEFPILLLCLSSLNLVDKERLKKGRRYAIISLLIVSALITPADVGSMILVMIPLYCLYELSILLIR